MDLGDVGDRVKKALELDRKIKFIKSVSGLSEESRKQLLVPLEAERLAVLEKGLPQGSLPLPAPKK